MFFLFFSELRALYEQYKESRSRYHYFREKLQKELSLQAVTTPPIGAVGRVDLTRTVQAPITVSYATPIRAAVPKASYPGAQQTPIISTQSHRTSIYPGATPTPTMSAPTAYPGAQASVYTTQQSAFVFNCCPDLDREIKEEAFPCNQGRNLGVNASGCPFRFQNVHHVLVFSKVLLIFH